METRGRRLASAGNGGVMLTLNTTNGLAFGQHQSWHDDTAGAGIRQLQQTRGGRYIHLDNAAYDPGSMGKMARSRDHRNGQERHRGQRLAADPKRGYGCAGTRPHRDGRASGNRDTLPDHGRTGTAERSTIGNCADQRATPAAGDDGSDPPVYTEAVSAERAAQDVSHHGSIAQGALLNAGRHGR